MIISTQVAGSSTKRTCEFLSALREEGAEMQQIIDQAIQKSISEVLLKIMESATQSFLEQLNSRIKTIVEQFVNNMKENRKQRVNVNMEKNNTILESEILSQNGQLENYNRWDKLKIIGIHAGW